MSVLLDVKSTMVVQSGQISPRFLVLGLVDHVVRNAVLEN
jgi:hypothetical protein